MRNVIPAMGALQAFEATARLGSFSRAAEELSLTHSAIYRQVSGLEGRLGVQLFKRVRRRIVLTDAGKEYAARVRHHLEQLEKDTLGLISRAGIGHNLHLAVLPTLANIWLLPRLPEFYKVHPDISISLSVRTLPFQFADHPYDAAIYHSTRPWPQTKGIRLFSEQALLPVCSPIILKDKEHVSDLPSLQRLPHLHIMSRPDAWSAWYREQGIDYPPELNAGPRYDLFSMSISAAIAGMGVALVPLFLAQRELNSKQLVVPWPGKLTVQESYYFGYPENREPSVALRSFEDWLLGITTKE